MGWISDDVSMDSEKKTVMKKLIFLYSTFLMICTFAKDISAPPGGVDYSKCAKIINDEIRAYDSHDQITMPITEVAKDGSMKMITLANYSPLNDGSGEFVSWKKDWKIRDYSLALARVAIYRDKNKDLKELSLMARLQTENGNFWDTIDYIINFQISNGECVIERISLTDHDKKVKRTWAYTPLCMDLHNFFQNNTLLKRCHNHRSKTCRRLGINREILSMMEGHLKNVKDPWVRDYDDQIKKAREKYNATKGDRTIIWGQKYPIEIAGELLGQCKRHKIEVFYRPEMWQEETSSSEEREPQTTLQ